jgi:DNA-nicking Smr family endonuclease
VKKPGGKDRRRHLHGEEESLWAHTASSVEPLKTAKGRVHPADELHEELHARPRPKTGHHETAAQMAKLGKKAQAEPPTQPAKKAPPPPLADIERKKLKRLRSGRIDIDGRIDLHGMYQDEAHGTLRAFLHRAQAKGWRWVLVITGKGRVLTRDHDAPFDMHAPRDRGVLKRNVPRWLEEPDLRPLVISYTIASIEHGGEGALYVHLRKRG